MSMSDEFDGLDKVKRRSSVKKSVARKMKRSYDIHAGQPTGREVQAMHRLQVLSERL